MNGEWDYRRSARKGLNWLVKNRLLKKSRLGDRDGIEQARAVDQRNQCETAGERGAGNGSEKCVHNCFLMLFFKKGCGKGLLESRCCSRPGEKFTLMAALCKLSTIAY